MVLEFTTSEEVTLQALVPDIPIFISYLLSFLYLATYWTNHHHLMHVTVQVNGKILWANLHLLFWLSLIPFATSWLGEHYTASAPVAFYGFVLLMSAIAYSVLQRVIIDHHEEDFLLRKAIGKDLKGNLSLGLYITGVALAYLSPWAAIACYVLVLVMWVVPDTRIESNI